MPKSDGYSASTRLLTRPRSSSGGAAWMDARNSALTRRAASEDRKGRVGCINEVITKPTNAWLSNGGARGDAKGTAMARREDRAGVEGSVPQGSLFRKEVWGTVPRVLFSGRKSRGPSPRV